MNGVTDDLPPLRSSSAQPSTFRLARGTCGQKHDWKCNCLAAYDDLHLMIIVIPTTTDLVSIGYDMSLNITIKVHFILVLYLTVFTMLLPLNLDN